MDENNAKNVQEKEAVSGDVEGAAAKKKRELVDQIAWEEKGLISSDQRAREISEAIANDSDTSRLQGVNIGEVIANVDKQVEKNDWLNESEVERLNSAENVKVRMERLGEIVGSARDKLLGEPKKDENVGREREVLQKKVVALTAALVEVGTEMMEDEESLNFEIGFRALQYAKVSLDVNEPKWATERIVASLEHLKQANGGKLPDDVAVSLAKASTWSVGAGTNAQGEYEGSSQNVAKIAGVRAEAIRQAEGVRLAEEEKKFRETWDKNREVESERYFGYSVEDSRTILERLYSSNPQRFESPGSQYLKVACPERITSASDYVKILAELDEAKIQTAAEKMFQDNKSGRGIYVDVAGKNIKDYERYYSETAEEEFKKQLGERIKREAQGHLMGLVVATYERQSIEGLKGNATLREMALKALGKGKMSEIHDGEHPDKFLTEMFHASLMKNPDVKIDFDRNEDGVEAIVRADIAFEKDDVEKAKLSIQKAERDQKEAERKIELKAEAEKMKEEIDKIKAGYEVVKAMGVELYNQKVMAETTFANRYLKIDEVQQGNSKVLRISTIPDTGLNGNEGQIVVVRSVLDGVQANLAEINKSVWSRAERIKPSFLSFTKYVPSISDEAFKKVPEPSNFNYDNPVVEEVRTRLDDLDKLKQKFENIVGKIDQQPSGTTEGHLGEVRRQVSEFNSNIEQSKRLILFQASNMGLYRVKMSLSNVLSSMGRINRM